jgi:hypothetical protein
MYILKQSLPEDPNGGLFYLKGLYYIFYCKECLGEAASPQNGTVGVSRCLSPHSTANVTDSDVENIPSNSPFVRKQLNVIK